MNYLLNLMIGLDQMANVLLDGAPDETLSARDHRQHAKGRSWMRNCINLLFFWLPWAMLSLPRLRLRRERETRSPSGSIQLLLRRTPTLR